MAAREPQEIDLVSGIVDTLRVLLGEGGASGAFVIAIGLMALYSFSKPMKL